VLEHTWYLEKVLTEFNRILKIDGCLILDTPNVYSLFRILRYLVKGKDVILGNPEHKLFFSIAMIENMLCKNGFKIEKIETENVFSAHRIQFRLPLFGPFRFLGECILAKAIKK
jgi:predicted SAM-dependent methyltransferase